MQGWLAQAEITAGHAPEAQPAWAVTAGASGQTECGPRDQLWPHGMTVEAVTQGGVPHGRDVHIGQLLS